MNETSVAWARDALHQAETPDEVRRILKSSARAVAGAQGATVVELDGDQCYYADEDAMSPLWKGQRFPVSACISGWAMSRRRAVVIPDTRADARIPQQAYRPTFVRSLVMVPVLVDGAPIGAVGVYWGVIHRAAPELVATLQSLVAAAAEALRRIDGPTPALT